MNYAQTKLLLETEHQLVSPILIGTDAEKIGAIQLWAELVSHLRSLNTTLVSFDNKVNLLNSVKKEIEQIELELHNVTAEPNVTAGELPSMDQKAPSDETGIVDLSKPEPEVIKKASPDLLGQLRRNAGIGYNTPAPAPVASSVSGPDVYVPEEPKREAPATFSAEAIAKLRRNAGVL